MMTTPLHVILVHGTWADGIWLAICDRVRAMLRARRRERSATGHEYWYQDGHRFGRDLRAALETRGFDVRMHPPLLWSGANSFGARFRAGADLAARLAAIDGRTLVIGHSHGGSVALQAVANLDAARASEVEVVTMNTPFVRTLRCLSPAQTAAFVAIGMLAFLLHTLTRARAQSIGIHDVLELDRFTSIQLALLIPAMLIVVRVAWLVEQWFEEHIVKSQITRFSGKRLQCIRGVSDEAGLVIAGGLAVSALSHLAYGLLGRLARNPWVVGAALVYAVVALTAAYGVWSSPLMLTVSSWVMAVVVAGVVGLWLFTALGNALLGVEFSAVGLLYMGSVDSTPDAPQGAISVDTLAVTHGTVDGMRHSAVYDHSDIVPLIVEGLGDAG